ncbi:hypothetical protein C0995_005740 [Termitomyces sp. Mi166|nr:hypothetical protein C0995_005740 [Termitomyces sp. Mi166\
MVILKPVDPGDRYVKKEELTQIISNTLAQVLERLTLKALGAIPNRINEWHHLNFENIAMGDLTGNTNPNAAQWQGMQNMQMILMLIDAPWTSIQQMVHEIVQEPCVDQYILTAEERIQYHTTELNKLSMLRRGNKRQVANRVEVPTAKQLLEDYHPIDSDKSLEAEGTQQPQDKGQKPMHPLMEDIPKRKHLQFTLFQPPTTKNIGYPNQQQDGTYKTVLPASANELE